MKQNRLFGIALLGMFAFTLISNMFTKEVKAATSAYGLSCTNKAYGTTLTAVDGTNAGYTTTMNASSTGIAPYVGTDCLYGGAAKTNSSAIVSGDVALMAANAIVGGINQRLDALSASDDTGAHMSYTNNGTGIGLAANRLAGGLGIWMNYADSDFDNDQTFTTKTTDSNKYDGDATAMTYGIDKQFGNFIVGVVGSSFDTDLAISANGGTYAADGETVGAYIGLKTSVLTISAGMGSGEYDVTTTRVDLGTGVVAISGSATADVEYNHFGISGQMQRGKIGFSPRINYKNVDIDTPAFTDVVANDANTAGNVAGTTGSGGLDATGKNASNIAVAANSSSSSTTEVGIKMIASLGMISPYLDLAYVSEDTTAATYLTEQSTDAVEETGATNSDGYGLVGLGVNLNVGSFIRGGRCVA